MYVFGPFKARQRAKDMHSAQLRSSCGADPACRRPRPVPASPSPAFLTRWRPDAGRCQPATRLGCAGRGGPHPNPPPTGGASLKSTACASSKGWSTVGESPNPASRQRSREVNLLPSGEIPAVKRGGTELRAAASSEDCRVERLAREGRGGRARMSWAKAASPVMDSGATGNSSGVKVVARSEGWPVNWGEPPAPVARSIAAEACAGIRREPKSGAARRQSEWAIVPMIAGTTEPGVGKGPHFGGACDARSG
jgi:hypothetical protein